MSGAVPPAVYVIAGPNGAGKTTFASKFLPDFVNCREFLNADLIAAGLAPFAPETQHVRAGRLLLERTKELTAAKVDFGFETTLSGRTYVRLLEQMKAGGYRVYLFFLSLTSANLAVARVANRVRQGGHHVPEPDVRRRFESGLKNFFDLYRPLSCGWWLYNGSRLPPAINRQSRERASAAQPAGPLRANFNECERKAMNEKQDALSEKVDAAFRATATIVIERAKQTGTPVIVWDDGRIKEIPSEQLEQPTKQQSGHPSSELRGEGSAP